MSWGSISHSKDIEPLLVKLYDEHRMYQLASEKKPEARAELSHTVAGLLAGDLKATEKEIIADILINLMRQAENDLKQALAERLSALENVPLRLVLHLAQDKIAIAETILRNSPVLNDLDLLYIIQSQDADYWRVIAERHKLNDPVINALAETRDVKTACVLVENKSIQLPQYAVSVLAEIAECAADVARPLLMRSEVPEILARRIYQVIGHELQKTVEAIVRTDKKENEASVLSAVKDILAEFSPKAKAVVSESPRDEYLPTEAMVKAAQMFLQKDELTTDLMLKTLKRGQISSFIAQLAVLTGTSAPKILAMLYKNEGRDLAALCQAKKLPRQAFIGIYLMTQKLRDSDGKVDRTEFQNAVSHFDQMSIVAVLS